MKMSFTRKIEILLVLILIGSVFYANQKYWIIPELKHTTNIHEEKNRKLSETYHEAPMQGVENYQNQIIDLCNTNQKLAEDLAKIYKQRGKHFYNYKVSLISPRSAAYFHFLLKQHVQNGYFEKEWISRLKETQGKLEKELNALQVAEAK